MNKHEHAMRLIKEQVDQYHRWGKMSIKEDPAMAALVQALVDAGDSLFSSTAVMSAEEVNKLKRQLTASKAREAKMKKQIEELQAEIYKFKANGYDT